MGKGESWLQVRVTRKVGPDVAGLRGQGKEFGLY